MGMEYSSQPTGDTTLVTTAETVVATVSGVSMQRPGQTVRCKGDYQITLGTGTTGLVTRVRRGGLTGSLVGEGNTEQISSAAGSTEEHGTYVEEGPTGEIAGATYVLTVQQVAATANGTVLQAGLDVTVS